ncbi:MAG TPA: LON peptidase substrate-binding domain-containing protein [Aggregatilineales bacterium]|nr:LON peptidase substrate-binding domain-containing protein [Aggregatilineales bacterium]
MMDLPLFPLNTVLFPGMPLNLHIFEDRYKQMMNECIEKRQPFGVVLISNDQPDTARRVKTALIGCTAQISQVQPLREGRMNISAIGRERFKVLNFKHDQPYLTADVDLYPLLANITSRTLNNMHKLKNKLEVYLKNLEKAGQLNFHGTALPNDPNTLAYFASVLLQIEPIHKQPLLEISDLSTMIESLLTHYRKEVALLNVMLNPPDDEGWRGVFSLN